MEDTPTTSKVNVRLSGVKTTLKRVAVKLEFSWQGLRDLDSMSLVAQANGVNVRNVAMRATHEDDCNRIVADLRNLNQEIQGSARGTLRGTGGS